MLIPFGVLSAAGAGGGAVAGSYDLIQTYILGSSQSDITFSNLGDYSSTYKHLQIRYTARTTRAALSDNLSIRFNSDTGSNYALHRLYGFNGQVFSDAGASLTSIAYTLESAAANGTANNFAAGVVEITDAYATKNKTVRALSGRTTDSAAVALTSGLWMNTGTISSITFASNNAANLVSGSRFSIYGIKG